MAFFYKVYVNEERKALVVRNWGCNFRCKVCTYRIKSPYDGSPPIPPSEVARAMEARRHEVERVIFVGGEPTTNEALPLLVQKARELGLQPCLGHTNGSNYIKGVASAVVSLKAFSEKLHLDYTGHSNKGVLENTVRYFEEGVRLKVNTVLVPGYVDVEEVRRIAKFLGEISQEIPLHIIGYIPCPGLGFRAATEEDLQRAVKAAREFLRHVSFWIKPSSPSPQR